MCMGLPPINPASSSSQQQLVEPQRPLLNQHLSKADQQEQHFPSTSGSLRNGEFITVASRKMLQKVFSPVTDSMPTPAISA